MKKLLILFCLFCSLCRAESFTTQKGIVCAEFLEVMIGLKEFNEIIIFKGEPTGPEDTGSFIVLMENKETGTWTILQYSAKVACVLAVGKNEKS